MVAMMVMMMMMMMMMMMALGEMHLIKQRPRRGLLPPREAT